MKYEYKKVKGYDQNKFIENGHTMFEEDVLQRLKRLAYLEEQLKQANDAESKDGKLPIPHVVGRSEQLVCDSDYDDFDTKDDLYAAGYDGDM